LNLETPYFRKGSRDRLLRKKKERKKERKKEGKKEGKKK